MPGRLQSHPQTWAGLTAAAPGGPSSRPPGGPQSAAGSHQGGLGTAFDLEMGLSRPSPWLCLGRPEVWEPAVAQRSRARPGVPSSHPRHGVPERRRLQPPPSPSPSSHSPAPGSSLLGGGTPGFTGDENPNQTCFPGKVSITVRHLAQQSVCWVLNPKAPDIHARCHWTLTCPDALLQGQPHLLYQVAREGSETRCKA